MQEINTKSKNIMDLVPQPEIKSKTPERSLDPQRNDRFQGTNERVFINDLREKLYVKNRMDNKNIDKSIKRTDAVHDKNHDHIVRSNKNDDPTVKPDNSIAGKEVSETNKAAANAVGDDMNVDPKKLESLEKAIKSKTAKIKDILSQLGFDLTPEQIQSPEFIKKISNILESFLSGKGMDEEALRAAIPEIEQALSIKISAKPEQLPELFKDLKNDLAELKTLTDIKDFITKSAAVAENSSVILAENVNTSDNNTTEKEQPETILTSIQGVNEDTDKNQVIIGEKTLETTEKPETQQSANGKTIPDVVPSSTPVEEISIQSETPNTTPEPVAEEPKDKKQVKTSEIQTVSNNNTIEIKAETLSAEIKAVVTDASNNDSTKPVKTKPAQETKPEIIAAIAGTVVDNKKKPKIETGTIDNVKTPITTETTKTETQTKAAIKELLESQSKSDGKQELKNYISQKPEADPETIKPETSDKNTLIKTLSELKETIIHSFAQAKVENDQRTMDTTSVKSRFSYLSSDRAIPEKAVLNQIVSKFQLLTGQHGSEIRVQLKPDQLGSIKISIEVNQDVVSTRIQVENEKVKEIIDNNVQTLKNALTESGIKVEKLDVTVDNGQNDFYKRELSEQGRRARGIIRTGFEESSGEGDAVELEPSAETGRRLGYNTVEFVG